jgi:hypothetical protein
MHGFFSKYIRFKTSFIPSALQDSFVYLNITVMVALKWKTEQRRVIDLIPTDYNPRERDERGQTSENIPE